MKIHRLIVLSSPPFSNVRCLKSSEVVSMQAFSSDSLEVLKRTLRMTCLPCWFAVFV